MQPAPRPLISQYPATAKWLHWLAALLLLSVLSAAWGFAFEDAADRASAIPFHASIGLALVFLVIAGRAARRTMASPQPVSAFASFGQAALSALILLQGVLGLWMAALSPIDIRFFNGFDLSALGTADADAIARLRPVHFANACLVTLLLAGHVTVALWHHFVRRDDVLIRMLPFSGLWQRLNAPARAQAWRFPSLTGQNWPRGRLK